MSLMLDVGEGQQRAYTATPSMSARVAAEHSGHQQTTVTCMLLQQAQIRAAAVRTRHQDVQHACAQHMTFRHVLDQAV